MLIHHVQTSSKMEFVNDPERGRVLKSIEYQGPGSTSKISHGGQVYEALEDGSFEVPDEVAKYLFKHKGHGVWYPGPNPFHGELAEGVVTEEPGLINKLREELDNAKKEAEKVAEDAASEVEKVKSEAEAEIEKLKAELEKAKKPASKAAASK